MVLDFKNILIKMIKKIPIVIFVLGVLIFICLNFEIFWKLYESFIDDGYYDYWKNESVNVWFFLFF